MSRRPNPADLSDAEWLLIASYIPSVMAGGRPALHERREIVDAICYVLRGGCSWRLLPHDFPPWQTFYHYFRGWCDDGKGDSVARTAESATVNISAANTAGDYRKICPSCLVWRSSRSVR